MDEKILANLFNSQEQGTNDPDILKAIIAGNQTGRDLNNTVTSGPSLKPESLDPVVKLLEHTNAHIKLFGMLPKHTIFNTVHEYNQLVRYGDDINPFVSEGESPTFTDTDYRRKSALVKYLAVGGELTQQAMLVKRADGRDPYTAEVESKTLHLLKLISVALTNGNSNAVPLEFDGIWRQHYLGIGDVAGTASLDNYFNDVTIIDARGKALSDLHVQDATQAIYNDRFGMATTLIAPPAVLKDYATRYQDQKRFLVGQAGAITNATTGQSVNEIQTQFGPIRLESDIFMDRKTVKKFNSAATSTNAPASVTFDGTTPIAAVTDTATKFGDGAGSYFYGVTARNRYGESAIVLASNSAQAVTSAQAINLNFSITNNANPATSFVVYRTERNAADRTTADFHPLFEVTVAERTAGYDGGSAGIVRDRNRFLSNTHSAIVIDPTAQMWEYIQLAGTMKLDFAITQPSKRFMVYNYGTPVLYQPGKMVRIVNIGTDLS